MSTRVHARMCLQVPMYAGDYIYRAAIRGRALCYPSYVSLQFIFHLGYQLILLCLELSKF